jgi:hypothetical protein
MGAEQLDHRRRQVVGYNPLLDHRHVGTGEHSAVERRDGVLGHERRAGPGYSGRIGERLEVVMHATAY